MKLLRYFLLSAFIATTCSIAQSQQGEDSGAETDSEIWKTYYLGRAQMDYQFHWSDEQIPLELRPKAIVNWTNPLEKGQINGSTYVWEHGGRPIVIGQLFSYLIDSGKRSYCHVFSSLSEKQVVGRRNGQVFWNPRLSTQDKWIEFTSDSPPAQTRPGRLLQMRRIARQIEAYTEEASRGTRKLRLLPQPLYRSDAATKDFDCGLFGYVVGTDPELMVLIECDLSVDEPHWRYRFSQSTRSLTVANFNGLEVYRYNSKQDDPQSPKASYLSRHGVELIPGDFE